MSTRHIVEIKKILEKNNNYLRQTFHIMELGIFGSFVKGEEKIDNASDIDILIKEAVKPRLKERIFREVEYV